MPAFVLEIGTEELPARFLADAENELASRMQSALTDHGLSFSGVLHASTPRRLLFFISNLTEQAESKEEVVVGPPLKAAYDLGGRPTRAAEGFAKTHGVALEDTYTLETEKGPYLAVRKTVGGGTAFDVLSAVCPQIIASLPFPKRMRWGSNDFTFARPLRWITCMLGDKLIPFSVGPAVSGNQTYGHRVHGFGPFTLDKAEEYFHVVEDKCFVVVENEKRLASIKQEGTRLAMEKKGIVLWKESLLKEVQGLCERPIPILGSFDPSFLEVPREVLLTSMESHQKSFGLESNDGRLLPYFLTVLNMRPDDMELVRKGWERVLRARLEDARFFWKTDLQTGFDAWLQSLDSVIFLAPLGSMGDKTKRISSLCEWLVDAVKAQDPEFAVSKEDAARAGRISKADLVSEMVKEFDTLQGIMGGIYAAHAEESDVVATAIAEQYLPAGPDSPVPSSLCGSLVSIADKADTLVGCFGLGMIPSGTADPYALRRAVLGIARIILEKNLRLDVRALLQQALSNYGERKWKLLPDQCIPRIEEFFAQRLKNYFIAAGYETLFVESCLLVDSSDVWAVANRIEALTAFGKSADFEATVLTFKRLVNIIRKQPEESNLTGIYSNALLTDDAEKSLALAFEEILPRFDALWDDDDYASLFALIQTLRPKVDAFFDAVMVMCEDEKVRTNRLNLLKAIVERLGRLADFSALQM